MNINDFARLYKMQLRLFARVLIHLRRKLLRKDHGDVELRCRENKFHRKSEKRRNGEETTSFAVAA